MPHNFTPEKSTLVQVMVWCRQATNHYLSQCWPRSVSPYGITRPQWVNITTIWSVCQPWTQRLMLSSMRSHSAGLWNGEGLGPQGISCLRHILLAGSKAKGSFHSSHFKSSWYQIKFYFEINQVLWINITVKFWVKCHFIMVYLACAKYWYDLFDSIKFIL